MSKRSAWVWTDSSLFARQKSREQLILAGISVLSFPLSRKASPPAPSCQPHVALAPCGGREVRFGRSAEPLCEFARPSLPRRGHFPAGWLPSARWLAVLLR